MLLRGALELAAAFLVFSLAGLPAIAAAQTADDLLNSETLHRIDLFVNSRDWAKLKADFQLDDYYPADLRWSGLTVRNVGIRSRGLGSRSGSKPGLRVDFNRYASGQEFLGLKSLVLDNLVQDPSNIREAVAMRFFERMGLPAPREAFAQLYVNNEDAGLYSVVESIDKNFLSRVFGEHDGDVENDGYLYEYRWKSPYYFTYLGPELSPYVEMFKPQTHEHESEDALYRPIEVMIRAVNETADGDFLTAASEYLDLNVFVKHMAVQNFLAEWDGFLGYAGINNFYFYRFERRNLSQLIAWDEDNAFRALDYPILLGHDENVLMRRVMRVRALRDAYFEALLASAASAAQPSEEAIAKGDATPGDPEEGPGWLEREIARLSDLIRTAAQQDTLKPYANEDFEAAVAGLLQFARERVGFVRCEVTKITDAPRAASVCAPGAGAPALRR